MIIRIGNVFAVFGSIFQNFTDNGFLIARISVRAFLFQIPDILFVHGQYQVKLGKIFGPYRTRPQAAQIQPMAGGTFNASGIGAVAAVISGSSAESTKISCSLPAVLTKRRMIASAVGERQMFPVQTNKSLYNQHLRQP